MASNESFLPEDYLQKKIATRTNAICITLFALVMAGVVGAFMVTGRQRVEVRRLQAEVNVQFQEAAKRLEQLDQLQIDKKLMMQRKKVAEVLVERLPRSVILAELTNLMPATLSLLEFDMETKVLRNAPRPKTAIQREAQKNRKNRNKLAGPNQAEIKPTELTVSLVGVAPTDLEVSQFLAKLNEHELFQNIFLRYSEGAMVQDREMRKFEIQMALNQDITPQHLDTDPDLTMDPMGDTIQINQQGKRVLTQPGAVPASNPANGKDR
jgi:Tfp pilus assembly protein PilN